MTETMSRHPGDAGPAAPSSMTDVARRAIALTFDFNRAILADPSILDDIPDGATIVLIPSEDPELAEAEVEQGLAALRQGRDVYFRHVRPGDRRPPVEPSADEAEPAS